MLDMTLVGWKIDKEELHVSSKLDSDDWRDNARLVTLRRRSTSCRALLVSEVPRPNLD